MGFSPNAATLRTMGEDALAAVRDDLHTPRPTALDHVVSRLLAAGFSVTRTHDAPQDYDLIVCGTVRVRVLEAVYHASVRWARFRIGDPDCHALALVLTDAEHCPSMAYYLPRSMVRRSTLSIGPSSHRLEDYAEATGVISALCG